MNRIAIIGASYLQLPLILKAKSMGLETHVFAWAANDVGETAADFFYPISIVEKERILEKCREIGICGITSIASDLAMLTVNFVAEKLGLPGNPMEATMKSTNKHLMRRCFEDNLDPSPKSFLVNETTDIDGINLGFPAIVKPTDRSGSRGICKVSSKKELKTAVERAISESFEKKALVEEFAEGDEYSVEGITYRGQHHILTITKKYTTGAPGFIEMGHRQPADLSEEMYYKVEKVVLHALHSLGLFNSASHAEIKIDSFGNVKIIEIGGRMGGDCIGSHMVLFSTGVDYLKAVIQVALGKEPDLSPKSEGFPVEVRFLFSEEDVEELERIKRFESERLLEIVDFHPENIGKTTDSSNRAGCYLIKL